MLNHSSQPASLKPEDILGTNENYDRNFDDLAEKFCRNIYGSTKGKLRQAIVNQDLETWYQQDLIQAKLNSGQQLHIVEAGGGDGRLAIQWAKRGHKVTFCDLSIEMVNRAKALAQDENLSNLVTCLHIPAQELHKALTEPADLVISHAVLEWIADQGEFLNKLALCLNNEGTLSLMFYNADAAFFRNAIMGNFKALLKGEVKRVENSLVPMYPLSAPFVYKHLENLGLTITQKTGVRVFHDYLKNPKQQSEDFDLLLELEQRYCREFPYVNLGRYIHVLAQNSSRT